MLFRSCDRHNEQYYPRFKKWCDEYFWIKHRNESRGVGGIFYDYINTGDWEADFAFTQSVGKTFLDIYPKLVRRHMFEKWTPEQREWQLVKRGRYVEFNLLYDRGTRFGLMTGGNTVRSRELKSSISRPATGTRPVELVEAEKFFPVALPASK